MGARDRQARAFVLTLDKDLQKTWRSEKAVLHRPTKQNKEVTAIKLNLGKYSELPATRVVGHKSEY